MPIGYDEYRELQYELGFDAPCYACESEQDAAYEAERWAALSPEERHASDAVVAAYSAARTEAWANEDDVGF